MKNQMYITLLILPLLATGCGGRKETAQTMPIPEIRVARPTVQNITLTLPTRSTVFLEVR